MATLLLSESQLLLMLVLYQGANLVSSNTKTAIYCFPLPRFASLSCGNGFIIVTKAYMGSVGERALGFCERPRVMPDHRKYDEGNVTDMMRKNCNLFRQCHLHTIRGVSQLQASYIVVEYWCTETDLLNNACMNLFEELTAFGNKVIMQTKGYPSNEIAATDISCDINNMESIPRIRMDIYDFTSNSSERSSYCIEWNGELKNCTKMGGAISTFLGYGGNLRLRQFTVEPLTVRLMMTLTAIDTPDGSGNKSSHPFNITCQPMEQPPATMATESMTNDTPDGLGNKSCHPFNITCQPMEQPPATMATESTNSFPFIIGSVLSIIGVVCTVTIAVLLKNRRNEKCKVLDARCESPQQTSQEVSGTHNNPHDYVNVGPDYEGSQSMSAYGSLHQSEDPEHSYQNLTFGDYVNVQ